MIIGFGGTSTEKRQVCVDEHFELVYSDECKVLMISRKEYEHVEDGLTFKYRYIIRALDLTEATGEDGEPIVVELLLTPTHDSLCEEERKSISESMMWSSHGLSDEWKTIDIAEYGSAVTMECEAIELVNEDEYSLMELAEMVDVVERITMVYEAIDSLRGFFLDRPWNLIGTNGWDTLKSAVNNEELFKRCL